MAEIIPFSMRLSLRLKVLIPLIAISFVVYSITFWAFYRYLVTSFEEEIKKRAETIASMIIYSNDVSQDPRQIQRLITTLNLEPDINLIATVAGNPPEVFASSRVQWVDKNISFLPDLPERPFLRASATSTRGYHYEKRTEYSFIYITSLKVTRPKGVGLIGTGALLLDLDVSSRMKELREVIIMMAAGLAFSTILVAFFIYLTIRRFILVPAKAIKSVMMHRTKGDTQERVPVYFHDEIGSIARSLNDMLDQLERESARRSLVENRLRESESKLMELNSNKDRFFSIIAHDLKSPFNALMGFARLLRDEYEASSPEQHLLFIRRISDGLSNLYKLLENLLEWSRIQLGGIEFHPERLDIGLIAFEIVHDNKLIMDKKGIRVRVEMPEGTTVFADENMIKTILRNLVSNALKFSPSGKTVTIGVIHSSECEKVPEGFIGLKVVDQGVGISRANLGNLFKIDSGIRQNGTSNETGTGLGLVLCTEFVEMFGGKIWVESEEGKGSTFVFTVPVT